MDWGVIGVAVLGGGIVGQVFTVFCTNYLTDKREYKKWRLIERHKASSELLDILASNPQNESELSKWTHNIRNGSLKVHILYRNGVAPEKLNHALEVAFKLAQREKDGVSSENWSQEFRVSVSELRKQLSNHINHD
ncbi:hypothetical protein Shal_0513 [Shewanella halifaxensis HAW-EB4]|uniref:Uncharacterized protein n=1 Tax=Shewanella halifaxensis (strain HAW-EB4) TaxID=458817 RepID=B0TRB6_SHEHH|nr:hypothetical protein [Shewanella halifaxensis]ABZ75088.1 hypothetical protein Shal_0513 [Shewanella halifaxensis HAW-EB4]